MQVWKRIQQVQGEIRSQLDAEFDSLCVNVAELWFGTA